MNNMILVKTRYTIYLYVKLTSRNFSRTICGILFELVGPNYDVH